MRALLLLVLLFVLLLRRREAWEGLGRDDAEDDGRADDAGVDVGPPLLWVVGRGRRCAAHVRACIDRRESEKKQQPGIEKRRTAPTAQVPQLIKAQTHTHFAGFSWKHVSTCKVRKEQILEILTPE